MLQAGKKILQILAGRDQPIYGSFQPCLIAGPGLGCGTLNIALALILSGDDHGQSVFLAQPVAGAAYKVIAALIAVVVLMIHETDSIENQVVMDMPLVNMGGQYKFVLAAQDLFASCIPISWASSGETSPGEKACISAEHAGGIYPALHMALVRSL